MNLWPALAAWAGVDLSLCLLGALLLARQPIGQGTAAGLAGSLIVHWGYRVGNGRLARAVGISWVVWMVVGAAAIGIVKHRAEPAAILLILAWLVDGLLLMRLCGIAILFRRSGRLPWHIMKFIGVLIAMIACSAGLWWGTGGDWGRRMALWLAGGPPLLIGGGYGLLLLVMLAAGRKARWN